MDRKKAISELKSRELRLRELGVLSLYLFGSTARGDALPGSDVDLFIDHEETDMFSLFDLLEIKYFLEDSIHAPIDIMTRRSIHPVLKESILAEAERVF
ncbi:MAG: nucleotidyltransferase domain-containing protein [Alphaproteobacteria bacterium]|jgi:predicted nucleotidyltransferase|nr:nucleotidyltransferase domain-containing protein [Alphaproteobacteria bacterium]